MKRRRDPKHYRPGETFARLSTELLTGEAYKAIPDWGVRVLTALAAQWRGKHNGDITLTNREAREFGISPPWKLHAGLQLLMLTGLIERMRVGRIENGKGIPSLYALGWEQIDPSDKYDLPIIVARPAPNAWARWTKPSNWNQLVTDIKRKAQGKKNAHTTRVTQAAQPGCTENDPYRTPHVTQETPFPAQPGVSPLEILAGGADMERFE